MTFRFIIISSILFFTSCANEENTEHENSETEQTQEEDQGFGEPSSENIIDFRSAIRPEKTDWNLNATYLDTLRFVSYEDQYDYWFAIFESKKGESISINYSEPIDASLNQSVFAIEWKIDSFYEAGEGDELYYNEQLISYSVLDRSNDFDGFLREFIKAYSRADNMLIEKHINSDLGFFTTFQPGVYCVLEEHEKPEINQNISWECVIAELEIKGSICDEYGGTENGLYYQDFKAENIEEFTYTNDEGDFIFHPPYLPSKFENNPLKQVQIILDEYHYAYLYFVLIDDQWCLWVEDLCDCSA